METDFRRLQHSHFSRSDCTGYIYQNGDEAEFGVLRYDTALYLRRILPSVMMLHHIPEELLTAVNELDCFISVQSTGAV